MKFSSKTDKSFILLISIAAAVILAAAFIPLWLDPHNTALDNVIVFSIAAFSIGLILWPAFSISYIFLDDHLFVKAGPFKSRIPYKEITLVTPTSDILTGYRLLSSRDGIEIFYSTGFMGSVKISPENGRKFLYELKKRCPHAKIKTDPA